MKTKLILIAVLTATFAGSAGWFVQRVVGAPTNADVTNRKILYYTCPMHPTVKADKPGDCPICGMKLQPVYEPAKGTNAPPVVAKTNLVALATTPACCSSVGDGCCN